MDFDDNVIIPAIYHKIYGVDAPLLTVYVGEKDIYLVGLLDHNGNVIFPAEYSSISWLKNKTHLVCCKDGHCEVYQYTLKN